MKAFPKPTLEMVSEALTFIPANLPRDEWVRIGMAIKSEFPDDTGLHLFDIWSATDTASYDLAAVQSTWRSISADGGVGIGTLLYKAKQNGYVLPTQRKFVNAASTAKQPQHQRKVAEQSHHVDTAAEAEVRWCLTPRPPS